MELFISLCGFVGSWLLVAGPVYQAALELRDEAIEQDHFTAVRGQLPPPTPVSAWWWLLPPVKIIMERKRNDAYHRQFIAALPSEDVAAMLSFINKATAWLTVGMGGLLIALKETYTFTGQVHLAVGYFWLLSVVLLIASVANTAVRIARSEQIRKTAT